MYFIRHTDLYLNLHQFSNCLNYFQYQLINFVEVAITHIPLLLQCSITTDFKITAFKTSITKQNKLTSSREIGCVAVILEKKHRLKSNETLVDTCP